MGQPTLSIPKDLIDPIIHAQITAAVAQAMGPSAHVMQQAIASILSTQVDNEGKPSAYGRGQSWLDWAVADSIRKAAKAAIEESVAGLSEAMRKQFIAELGKKNSPMVKQLVDGMVSGVFKPESLRYRLTVAAEG